MGQGNSSQLVSYPPDKMAPFFPKTSKECADSTNSFFKCLNEKTLRVSETDTEAGTRALAMCVDQKAAYEVCMQKTDKIKKPKKYFRVQEEYRLNGTKA